MNESTFQHALREQPDDNSLRLVFADWLDEHGDPRGELIRLTHTLTSSDPPGRRTLEANLRALLTAGVPPIGPFFTNSLGMRFAWVPPGTFQRGSPLDEPGRQDNETPHPVTLTRGFYMGVHPVTQAQWQAVMGVNPSRFVGPERPVECVSWEDCLQFCGKLTQHDGVEAGLPSPYRLPTEAEWEFACRASTSSAFFFGERVTTTQANFHANYVGAGPAGKYRQETTPVNLFSGNAWGLHDLHGNVFEWCADAYSPYPNEPVADPEPSTGSPVRILRGGSWHSLAERCRSACRCWGAPGYCGSDVGFRLCFRLDYHFSI